MVTARRVDAFTSGLGVNIHLPGGQGNAYGELAIATIAGDFAFVGASLIRDDIPDPGRLSAAVMARYAALARAGLKFDMCVGSSNSDLAAIIAALNAFAAANPGAIRYVEGPNEINYNPFAYKGLTGQDAAILFQRDLRDAVHGSPWLAGVQVLDFTGGGALGGPSQPAEPIAGIADLAATHVYPANGEPPAWYVSTSYRLQYGAPIGGPYIVTEAGYNSDPVLGHGVSIDVQAKQTLMLLLDTARSGATATILYELLDMYADPGNQIYEDHWGLFDASGAPTLTAIGIHNLQAILADRGPAPTTFMPDGVGYSLSNMPAAGRDWLLEKSSGVFDLVLWSEVPLWNPATRSAVPNPGSAVTIDLGRSYDYVDVYDPLGASGGVAHLTNARQLTLTLADHPLVLQFGFGQPEPAPVLIDARTVAAPNALFRFFDTSNGTHFFTANAGEAAALSDPSSSTYRADLVPERNGFGVLPSELAAADPTAIRVSRFFDASNGTHFFTSSAPEIAALQTPGGAGYRPDLIFEPGGGFYAHSAPASADVAVYRLFDTVHGTHFFTGDATEYAAMTTRGGAGYRADLVAEGIGFYAPGAG